MIEMIIIVAIILFVILLIKSRETEEGAAKEKKEPKTKKEKGTIWAIGTLILGVTIWFTGVILGFFIKILFGGDKD